jgi:hypothetical protein
MVPTNTFCIDYPLLNFEKKPNEEQTTTIYHQSTSSSQQQLATTSKNYNELECSSSCSRSNHSLIKLVLTEEEGAGWLGSYFTVQSMGDNFIDNEPVEQRSQLGSFLTNTIGGGSLEWGFQKEMEQCLPLNTEDICYVLQLSYPVETEELPYIYFPDAYDVYKNTNTFEMYKSNNLCQFSLNTTVSLATLCLKSNQQELSYVTFYEQFNKTQDFGQQPESWKDFISIQSSKTIKQIGVCSLNLSYVKYVPNEFTYKEKDKSHDSIDFNNHNYSCFKNCSSFPGSKNFTTYTDQTCAFLIDMYYLCDSFSIAHGYCEKQSCATSCAIVDWCYFAAGMATTCPFHKSWKGNEDEASNINKQCVVSYTNGTTESFGDDDKNDDQNNEDNNENSSDNNKGSGFSNSLIGGFLLLFLSNFFLLL